MSGRWTQVISIPWGFTQTQWESHYQPRGTFIYLNCTFIWEVLGEMTQHSHHLKVTYVCLARSHYIQVSKVIFVKELVLPHEWVQFMGFIIFISPTSRVPFSQIRTVSCIWAMQTRHRWWPRCFLPMSRQGLGRKFVWPSSSKCYPSTLWLSFIAKNQATKTEIMCLILAWHSLT